MPTLSKKWFWIVGLPIGIIIAALLFSFLKMKYADYVWYKKTAAFVAAGEAPFRNDTYGGKTPEETWAMYIDAVKKRNIDLASKYVDVNHQKQEREFLERGLNKDNLNRYVYEISNGLQKRNEAQYLDVEKDRAYYFYQYIDRDIGKMAVSHVNFYLNTFTHIWKILY